MMVWVSPALEARIRRTLRRMRGERVRGRPGHGGVCRLSRVPRTRRLPRAATRGQTLSAVSASPGLLVDPARNARRTRTRKRSTCRRARRVSRIPRRLPERRAEDCLCSLGFYGAPGGPCAGCAANEYADALDTVACSACPANSQAPARSDVLTDCVCRLAFYGAPGGS